MHRLEPDRRGAVGPAGDEDRVGGAGGDLAAADGGRVHRDPPHLDVGIVRHLRQHVIVNRGGRDERFEREPAHARLRRRIAAGDDEPAQQRERLVARRAQLPLDADERFESFRDAEPIGNRFGAPRQVEQRTFRRFRLRCGEKRQATDRRADRRADVGVRFDFQAGDERRHREIERAGRRRRPLLPALRRLADGVGRFRADLGERVAQREGDVGNQRGALEAAERAHRDADRLRVAAVGAGPDDREIVRRRRAAILGLQHREARHARPFGGGILGARRDREEKQPRRHEDTKKNGTIFRKRSSPSCLRAFVVNHVSISGAVSRPSTRASGSPDPADTRSGRRRSRPPDPSPLRASA